ncbi:MAG: ammonium transporter [Moraxellaceae bacterium]|nr:MAG: ammonium transporter [Moraxellaceae bacterium]
MSRKLFPAAGLALLLCTGSVFAQDAAEASSAAAEVVAPVVEAAAPSTEAAAAPAAPNFNKGDIAWMLTSTLLVLFMVIPGLALFYGGMVRAKNVLSLSMQVFVTFCLISILWSIYGYSIAFTYNGNAFFGGFDRLFLKDMLDAAGNLTAAATFSKGVYIPEYLYAAFQMTFAALTPCLIVGAFAERIKFSAVLVFMVLWFTFSYLPIAHMVWFWSGPDAYTTAEAAAAATATAGYIFQMGALDFAGGTVVHITAGVGALVAALVIGKRNGFPTTAMPPHNMTMVVTGAGILWVGWFGFNAGSALAANSSAAMAMLVTHLSAAAGALAWMTIEWVRFKKPSVLGIVTGMVAGLGTITPASGYVGPGGAIVIGLLAGVVCFIMTQLVKRVWKIDDSLDVFPVHGVGGILGTFLAGIFASTQLGAFSGKGFAAGIETIGQQVQVQLIGIGATLAYTVIVTYVLLKLTEILTRGLRVTKEEEQAGLDISLHEEDGYKL